MYTNGRAAAACMPTCLKLYMYYISSPTPPRRHNYAAL
jgi:hypothetical protein